MTNSKTDGERLERVEVNLENISKTQEAQGIASTTPFTWTTNDAIFVYGTYEAA